MTAISVSVGCCQPEGGERARARRRGFGPSQVGLEGARGESRGSGRGLAAARAWVYKPALQKGRPVRSEVTVEIELLPSAN